MPPIPCNKKNFLFMAEPSPLEKCALSLAMTSVRPVNRLLGFGMMGMTPSDIALLLLWTLLIWICQRSSPSARWYRSADISDCSTHRVSCVECAAAHGGATSVRENVRSTHCEWWKMNVLKRSAWERKKGALTQYTDFHTRKHVPGLLAVLHSWTPHIPRKSRIFTQPDICINQSSKGSSKYFC